MALRVVQQLGRAGNARNREAKRVEWNLKYGEGNWEVVYKYGDKLMTREEALEEYYHKSYYLYMKENKGVTMTLCKFAKSLYNPHARHTGGVDLQCPAVMAALEKLNCKLQGEQEVAIGTWGTKHGYTYPAISYQLSPFKVPLWCNNKISVEEFWQEYKYLAVKE